MKRFSLGKEERLLKPPEFKRVLHDGKSQSTEHFKVFIFFNRTNKQRLGITTSRKIGAATKRNRIKRLLREFFRLHKTLLPPSSDILFVAKKGADTLDYSGLFEELKILLKSYSP
ncbi:MAG: ribonuclease P protein component [Deltaproteobacteria bacterium]|jgi:ribonuclease P protein component|nr:ribonuclease P protein component [Deltaproteobacteria bacterium]